MIEVQNPEKYRKCTACLSENKVMKIVLMPSNYQNLSHYLCHACFNELQIEAIKFQIQHEDEVEE